jgi:hypothetical protein
VISLRAAYNQRVVELHITPNGSLRELITAAPHSLRYREKIREDKRRGEEGGGDRVAVEIAPSAYRIVS